MNSIGSRLIIGTGLVLAIFVLLMGLSISYSVHKRAETARLDRLQGLIYGILGATDITVSGNLEVNSQALPDPMLNHSTVGMYAEIIGNDAQQIWQSTSTTSWIPDTEIRPIGDWQFSTVSRKSAESLNRLQLSTAWQFDNGEEFPFIVHVVMEADSIAKQLSRFNRAMWASLLLSAVALLIVQLFVLRHSLKPLRTIGEQVSDIEAGTRDAIDTTVPGELKSLTQGLNALLGAERARRTQYRHALDDLAHSLKTPLSVLQNIGNLDSVEGETVGEQTKLMQQSIERHLERTHLQSPRYLASALKLKPVLRRICSSLEKLYDSSKVKIDINNVDDDFTVRMDEADLMEVLGNLIENSCKYNSSQISVISDQDTRSLIIQDNGIGFPDLDLEELMQRGVRADTQTPGTGMGLAASSQLMAAYGGQLKPAHRPAGGAQLTLIFTPNT